MELVVVKKVLSIPVVVLHEYILVRFFMYAPIEFKDGVEIKVPAHALHEGKSPSEFFVGGSDLHAPLADSAIPEDIAVVLAIDYRYPEFGMHH